MWQLPVTTQDSISDFKLLKTGTVKHKTSQLLI